MNNFVINSFSFYCHYFIFQVDDCSFYSAIIYSYMIVALIVGHNNAYNVYVLYTYVLIQNSPICW